MMKLVSDWKGCWKWFSVHAMSLAGVISGAWLAVPGDMRAVVPEAWLAGVTAGLMILGIVGRLVDQK